MKRINVAICGVLGYVGRELLNLVLNHPHLNLMGVNAKRDAAEIEEELPILVKNGIPVLSLADIASSTVDLIFLATPPEVSMELVSRLPYERIKIIDLSGAYRLPERDFTKWYKIEHKTPNLLKNIWYGLSPWEMKRGDSYILANPGCYATTALIPLIPLLRENIVAENNIIIDGKSGASGAGMQVTRDLMFVEIFNNFYPYKIGRHQHTPEIINALKIYTEKECDIIFTTEMLPLERGISMTIYLDPINSAKSDREIAKMIDAAFNRAYGNYPLIEFDEINRKGERRDKFLLSLKSVIFTPKIHVGYFVNAKKIIIFSAIDNLLKGAASQAIENLNRLYDLAIQTGLLPMEKML